MLALKWFPIKLQCYAWTWLSRVPALSSLLRATLCFGVASPDGSELTSAAWGQLEIAALSVQGALNLNQGHIGLVINFSSSQDSDSLCSIPTTLWSQTFALRGAMTHVCQVVLGPHHWILGPGFRRVAWSADLSF